jgi:molybdenum cofactor cytidylyltransferase
MLSAVILSAGNSERMGFPKAILEYKGRKFLEIIISSLKNIGIKEINIVLGKDRELILNKISLTDEKVIFNDKPELGQIYSLRLALEKMDRKNDFMICLVDQPLIKESTYKDMADLFSENKDCIIIPKFLREDNSYKRGHPIIIPSIYRDLCLIGPIDKGLHWVVHNENVKVKELITNDRNVIIDFDTMNDYLNISKL